MQLRVPSADQPHVEGRCPVVFAPPICPRPIYCKSLMLSKFKGQRRESAPGTSQDGGGPSTHDPLGEGRCPAVLPPLTCPRPVYFKSPMFYKFQGQRQESAPHLTRRWRAFGPPPTCRGAVCRHFPTTKLSKAGSFQVCSVLQILGARPVYFKSPMFYKFRDNGGLGGPGGLGGSGGSGDPPRRWRAKPSTFWKGLPALIPSYELLSLEFVKHVRFVPPTVWS